MRYFISLGLLCGLFAFSGCSHDAVRVAPAPLPKLSSSVSLTTLWSENIGSVDFGGYRLEPLIRDEQIIASDIRGHLTIFDGSKGKVLWRKKLNFTLGSGLASDNKNLYLSNRDGEVFALSMQEKSINTLPVWRKKLSSEVLSSVAVSDELIAVQTADGHLYGLNPDTGEQAWVYSTELPSLTLRGNSRPQFAEGAVVTGFSNGKLVVVDAKTGLPIWEKSLALSKGTSEFDQLSDIDGDFVIANNIIYVGNYQGQVAAIELFTGRVIWTREISTYVGLFEDSGQLYISDSEGTVWALDSATGGTLWSQSGLKARQLSAPSVYDDYVVVGDFAGYLHLLSKQEGHFVGRIRIDHQGIKTQPQLYQDHLMVVGKSGRLVMLGQK